jgi:hypothetical protein
MAINFPANPSINQTWQDPSNNTNYIWDGNKWTSTGTGLYITNPSALASPVLSVFGRTGNVSAQEGDYNLDKMSDVNLAGIQSGQVLGYNGTSFGGVFVVSKVNVEGPLSVNNTNPAGPVVSFSISSLPNLP